jgi:LuxR family transcriptional regulator, quorum-sensing system regulator SdiA
MEARVIETALEALSDLDEYLSTAAGRPVRPRLTAALTERECDVLVLLADGLTTGQVATTLSVSEHTVRSRIKSTLGKLGARNREHAIAIAFREGAL